MVLMMRAMPKDDGWTSTDDSDDQEQNHTMDELAALQAEAQHMRIHRAREDKATTCRTDG